jgi:hypothetical protein
MKRRDETQSSKRKAQKKSQGTNPKVWNFKPGAFLEL